jgi:phosphatidylethanolamine-binding protein (PEBP) family uncharacterized protein
MKLSSNSFPPNGRIPQRCAFGIPDKRNHMKLGENRNPHLQWSDIPEGTMSLVLMCVDSDVPSSMDDFNQEGRSIPNNLPRCDFFHWVIVDIAPRNGEIMEGECSDKITVGGKTGPPGPSGSRQGINDYTTFMKGDSNMAGDYFGYDGPCPPWNDERLHHYHFVLYATSLHSGSVTGSFTGSDARKAVEDHILAEARLVGVYSLNPTVR